MQPHWPNAEKYFASRDAARKKSLQQFLKQHAYVAPVVALANEYVAGTMLSISGLDFSSAKHGRYVTDLMISFARTHFIAQDLIGFGELIEAAVLIRKQMELLARLHELAKSDSLAGLIRKNPQLRELRTHIRSLYSAYSAVAHSADPVHLQQLGVIERGGKTYTPLYPVYTEHAIVTFQHQVLTVIEFHYWCRPYLTQAIASYDPHAANEAIEDLARHYMEAFHASSESHV